MARPPPPYDPYYLAPPPPHPEYRYPPNEREGINTLFVSGLPDDIKAREIHNLFRRRPGYEFCQLKYTGRGNQVVAFATFLDPQSAMDALVSLDGIKFDPQSGSSLHIELARSNSRRVHTAGSGPYVVIDDRKKSKTDNTARDSSSNDEDSDSDDSAAEKSAEKSANGNEVSAQENEQEEKRADGACSTLFMANLGPGCTGEELKQVLSQYPGFNSIKVRSRGGMPVAFADFEGVEQATEAMNALQGSTLPSSDRGGMHIEYARSKMRKP